MRSISRFTVLAALLGAGLPAYANPPAPDSAPVPPYAAPAPMTPVMPYAPDAVVDTPRASVAAIMQEAGQALLWDGTRGEYVLVRAGDSFHDFRVSIVSVEQVVLTRGNQHFILPRTSDTSNLALRRPGTVVTAPQPADVVDPYATGGSAAVPAPGLSAGAPPAVPLLAPSPAPSPGGAPVIGMAPVDPYGAAAKPPVLFSPDELAPASGPALLDPYGSPAAPAAPAAPSLPSSLLESRVKSMPRKSAEPSAPAPRKSEEPSAPVAVNDAPRVTSMPRPVVQSQNDAASLRDEQHSLSRREFDAAISDFHALGRDVQVTQVADGVRVDEVAPSSLPYRMGVRAGDIVLDVDDKKIRTMNDAAAIYARLMDAEQFAVKVKRGTGIITLRYRFTR